MIIDRFEQQPNEIRVRRINYSEWLRDGEVLDPSPASPPESSTEQISGTTDDSANPFSVYGLGISADGAWLTYYAAGGAHGNSYKATFVVYTSTGQKKEDEIIFRIKEY